MSGGAILLAGGESGAVGDITEKTVSSVEGGVKRKIDGILPATAAGGGGDEGEIGDDPLNIYDRAGSGRGRHGESGDREVGTRDERDGEVGGEIRLVVGLVGFGDGVGDVGDRVNLEHAGDMGGQAEVFSSGVAPAGAESLAERKSADLDTRRAVSVQSDEDHVGPGALGVVSIEITHRPGHIHGLAIAGDAIEGGGHDGEARDGKIDGGRRYIRQRDAGGAGGVGGVVIDEFVGSAGGDIEIHIGRECDGQRDLHAAGVGGAHGKVTDTVKRLEKREIGAVSAGGIIDAIAPLGRRCLADPLVGDGPTQSKRETIRSGGGGGDVIHDQVGVRPWHNVNEMTGGG